MSDERKTAHNFSQLLTAFRSELGELFNATLSELEALGFERERASRTLLSVVISDGFATALHNGMTPEQCASFVSSVVNERLRSHQQDL
jgi:hypothetical protein